MLVQARTFDDIDLDTLTYKPLHGIEKVAPAKDLSGVQYELDEKEQVEKKEAKEAEGEKELATAALIA